jgi:hypothetical protein
MASSPTCNDLALTAENNTHMKTCHTLLSTPTLVQSWWKFIYRLFCTDWNKKTSGGQYHYEHTVALLENLPMLFGSENNAFYTDQNQWCSLMVAPDTANNYQWETVDWWWLHLIKKAQVTGCFMIVGTDLTLLTWNIIHVYKIKKKRKGNTPLIDPLYETKGGRIHQP